MRLFPDWLYIVITINSCLILFYDWRDKTIPLFLILSFIIVSIIYALFTRDDWLNLLLIVSVIFIGLFYCVSKKLLGLADCLLIPACFVWFEEEKISTFLILCGFLSVVTAVFWRWRHKEKDYPLTPAIIFSLGITFLA